MQFRHEQIIETPVNFAFDRITDFERFEALSTKKGFSFKRHGRGAIRIGTKWNVAIPYKGRMRRTSIELSELDRANTVSMRSNSMKYQGALSLSFTPVNARQCQVEMLFVAQARSLGAKLAFNGIRLARRRINKRIRTQMQEMADRLEYDYDRDI